jgi:plastocyanin
MKRLSLLIVFAAVIVAGSLTTFWVFAANTPEPNHAAHNLSASTPIDGPLSNATVSFGAWITPLDRHTNVPPPPSANHHVLIPEVAKIKAGGSVNFIISGLHQVVVYDDGTEPTDINKALLSQPAPGTPFPALIDDPTGRIYRGPDPRLVFPTLDRVEVVHFANPGTYLVICSVLPHFNTGMFGFVKVLP